jgi:hypothetical protein
MQDGQSKRETPNVLFESKSSQQGWVKTGGTSARTWTRVERASRRTCVALGSGGGGGALLRVRAGTSKTKKTQG